MRRPFSGAPGRHRVSQPNEITRLRASASLSSLKRESPTGIPDGDAPQTCKESRITRRPWAHISLITRCSYYLIARHTVCDDSPRPQRDRHPRQHHDHLVSSNPASFWRPSHWEVGGKGYLMHMRLHPFAVSVLGRRALSAPECGRAGLSQTHRLHQHTHRARCGGEQPPLSGQRTCARISDHCPTTRRRASV